MELEQAVPRPNSETEKRAKENSSAAGNHGDAHMNGMSNGFDRRKEHRSEHRDKEKERSHKSEHKEKDRSKDKEKSHKSEHRDKDRHKHSSTSNSTKDKDKHGSSSSSKDKEKKSSGSSSKDRDHKSSSSSSGKDRDKDKIKDRDHHHKSSSSSKDKDKHHSSSKDKESSGKDKERSKEKEKHKHSSSSSSSRDKEKDKSISKDKDKDRKHPSEKDKDRHSLSHSSSDKEKHRSSEKDKHGSSDKDKHRHDKDRDRHRHDKEKSRHRDDKDRKDKMKEEPRIKDEPEIKTDPERQEFEHNEGFKREFKEDPEDEDDSGGEQPLYIKEEEDEEEGPSQEVEDASLDSTDLNDTRLSELHNTTLKSEKDSDEDMPLYARTSMSSPTIKRKVESTDEEEDLPLSSRKKPKKENMKKKKKRKHADDEDVEYEEEEEEKPKKKSSKGVKTENTPSPRKKKKEEEAQDVWKWWEEEKKNDGTKWNFLEHKGPVFAPAYEPLPPDVKFHYNGKEIKLSEEAEEVATFYARMLDHDYTTKKVFNDNFFHDWREVMSDSERAKIVDLSKCNFKEMHAYFVQKNEERKAMSKEDKKKIKEQNEQIQKEYGFCTIDGHKEKIGNFKIEPPGLFRGRGEHPKMGKLKKRVIPEDVLINCSKDSKIPKPPTGHKWKEIRHDPNVTWLASWTENIQGQVKYVMLNPSSKLKGEKDWQKYETARKLAKSIDKIRAEYREDWRSKEMRIRQRAVALYFIDKLALRAGNEKDEDQADTVGCCSLRVEHISLHEQKDGREYVVVFDFLGKDSIRYYNEVPVEKRVYKNLQLFMENKSPSDDLFDRLNTTVMNKHLNELMEGLTAKVFRTYNASWTLQQQLEKLTNADDTVAEKILSYNRANRAVAILCNHQRSVPKTHAKSMENLKAKIDARKEAVAEAEMQVKDAKRDAKHGSVKEKLLYEKKKKQLDRLKEQLTKLEVQATDKEENKEIALGTSKLNYLDPRISVAWCKKYDVPIEKIYNKTQRDKFRWAIDMAGPDYVF
ncbi:DNA topoisomerase I, mitochondrial isoform X2 [Cephus cinctus]|uniref:DNA topoisomerase I n=1 Tax=Cephus cinctus TaxID=211228 RepID=A0AAJ7FUF6_CEPCN|nr:DNA topoisomerase I, mitochondrial isoform X2 [Cephus cinctus]